MPASRSACRQGSRRTSDRRNYCERYDFDAGWRLRTKGRGDVSPRPAKDERSSRPVAVSATREDALHSAADIGGWRFGRCRREEVMRRRKGAEEQLVGGAEPNVGSADTTVRRRACFPPSRSGREEFRHQPSGPSLGAHGERLRECVLLCANCHAEDRGGVTRLSYSHLSFRAVFRSRSDDRSGELNRRAFGC